MGEVYLAEHALLRRPCAVKLIRPERAGDTKNLARFEREVQATVTLTHPNAVQIYDYGHTEGGVCAPLPSCFLLLTLTWDPSRGLPGTIVFPRPVLHG